MEVETLNDEEIDVNDGGIVDEPESTQEIENQEEDEKDSVQDEPPPYEELVNEDTRSSNQDELASQVSEDQDEFTVINNDNYDVNNDSAYETNELNSQNGSNSRLQSAETNEEDEVDHETGENFLLLQAQKNQINQEIIGENTEMQNLEIERLEIELENPPTPTPSEDDNADVVLSAENPTETGDSTEGGNMDEVHDKLSN